MANKVESKGSVHKIAVFPPPPPVQAKPLCVYSEVSPLWNSLPSKDAPDCSLKQWRGSSPPESSVKLLRFSFKCGPSLLPSLGFAARSVSMLGCLLQLGSWGSF